MTEEDIKLNYITPALVLKGWQDRITMETAVKFTDGKVNLKGNITVREAPKKADYLLYVRANQPIAVVEAKDNNHTVSYGLQQAMTYAQMLDLPFAYSSNGDGFMEHDFLTGRERQLGLDEFPTPDELHSRLRQAAPPTPAQEAVRRQPYYSSQNTYPPRYYQRIAINRTVDAIARGRDRLLLVMATGTGKTYTAFQIVYRLLQSGLKQKILYLAAEIFWWTNPFNRTSPRWKRSFIRSACPRTTRAPSPLIRSTFPSTSSWWGTTIRSISAPSLPRISSISLSWTSVTGAPPRRRAAGGASWSISAPPPSWA
jgi:hypothetical protein